MTTLRPGAHHGLLVIADISGYTRFVSGVELEHGAAIVADLLGAAFGQLAGVATLAKFEGDAAFCVGDGVPGADSLMAAMYGCYDAFRRRLRDARHLTTCTCDACSQMSSLDLKIVVHAGDFLVQQVVDRAEVVGAPVILVHRLLKNSVDAHGYALLTDEVAREADVPLADWGATARTERVDDVGDVAVHVVDLPALWDAEQARTSVVVGADGRTMTFELPVAPAIVWDWFSDPRKRQRWNLADRIDVQPSAGASGVGTVNHCVHGNQTITEEIVDWKPFQYCTLRVHSPVGAFLMTVEMEPTPAGCAAEVRIRPEASGLKKAAFGVAYKMKIRKDFEAGMSRLAALVEAV